MSALAETIPMGVGDWQVRGRGPDEIYALDAVPDLALSAALWPRDAFDSRFPGWQLYRRIVNGCVLYDRDLFSWAGQLAQCLAHATRKTGHPLVRIGADDEWATTAGHDALARTIHGRWPVLAAVRGAQFDVDPKTYRKLRNPLAGGMLLGLQHYRAHLHAEYRRLHDGADD